MKDFWTLGNLAAALRIFPTPLREMFRRRIDDCAGTAYKGDAIPAARYAGGLTPAFQQIYFNKSPEDYGRLARWIQEVLQAIDHESFFPN